MPVTLGDDGLLLDGEPWPLLTGSVQYWRLDGDRWPRILDRVVEMGLPGIEVYMPWSAHERGPGAFDFTGRLDLARFLDLAALPLAGVQDAGAGEIVGASRKTAGAGGIEVRQPLRKRPSLVKGSHPVRIGPFGQESDGPRQKLAG